MFTFKPINDRSALWRSLGYGAAMAALKTLGGAALLLAMYPLMMIFKEGAFAMVPALTAGLHVLGIAVAIAMFTTFGSRLATIRMPLILVALPTAILAFWPWHLTGRTSRIGDAESFKGARLLEEALTSPTAVVVAMIVGACLMKPMANWSKNRAAIAYVALSGLLALQMTAYLTAILGGASTASFAVIRNMPSKLLANAIGAPEGIIIGILFIAIGVWQRKSTADAPAGKFPEIPIGRYALAAIAAAAIISLPDVIAAESAKTGPMLPYRVIAALPVEAIQSSFIYWIPILAALVTWKTWPKSRPTGAVLTGIALTPMALWVVAMAPHALRTPVDYAAQPAIEWGVENANGMPVLLPVAHIGTGASSRLKARGLGEVYETTHDGGPYRTEAKKIFAGGDNLEITARPDPEHVRIAPHGSAVFYAYVTKDGTRRLAGTRLYEDLAVQRRPTFPPRLIGASSFAREGGEYFSQKRRGTSGGRNDTIDAMLATIPSSR